MDGDGKPRLPARCALDHHELPATPGDLATRAVSAP